MRSMAGLDQRMDVRSKPLARKTRRLHVLIEPDLDVRLERRARAELMSKAALVRMILRTHVPGKTRPLDDAIDGLIARLDYEPSPLLPGDVYE